MKGNKIMQSMLYAKDMITYVEKYMKIMDEYYLNKENDKKIDIYAMGEYIKFKEECQKGAKERGLL